MIRAGTAAAAERPRGARAYKGRRAPGLASCTVFTREKQAMSSQPGVEPDRIDVNDEQALQRWAGKLDATPEQLREAVRSVGDRVADVEMHLKGARSSSNSDRVKELGG
jgi:hypothetical protein